MTRPGRGVPWRRRILAAWLAGLVLVARAEDDGNASAITAADIRRERPASLVDLLRSRAGVEDSSGSLTLRGVQGIAVVLDGLPAALSDLALVNPDDVERIDILRGAASARYGANAMGGAIVVTTHRRAVRPVVSLLGSAHGSLGARFSGERAAAGWRLGLVLADEFEQGSRRVPAAPYPNQVTVDSERYRNRSASLRAGYHPGAAGLDLEVRHTDSLSGYGRPNWWEHYRADAVRATLGRTLADGLRLELVAGHEGYDDLGLMDTGTGSDAAGLAADRHVDSSGANTDLTLTLAGAGGNAAWHLGAVYRHSRDRYVIRPYGGAEAEFMLDAATVNRALLGHYQRRWADGPELSLDARLDRHEYPAVDLYDAGGGSAARAAVVRQSFNPKAALRWPVGQGLRLVASAGTGFVPPSPYQLYYTDLGAAAWLLGNPDLKPERSLTRDIGLEYRAGTRATLAATLFQTVWTDKIGMLIVDYGTPVKRRYANIGEAEARGLELETRWRLDDAWTASLNYTWNRTRIVSERSHPERVGNVLPDMPRHKLNAALAYESAGLAGRLALRYASAAYTDEANSRRDGAGYDWLKPAYAVVDASLSRRWRDLDLTLAVDNLFDRRYLTGFFRLGQARLVRLELNWRI
ncbi:TonB-dependent receptor [Parasulfuritortus cantonensis]|uniref:TonB-dependent receptor n=1 Tax=Parasulfuritortus cantonensis TaxID=2528202 RepID=A0A4R1BDJ1_9PROT|nr:TonB-dependent receptor [Parasulfuritortus cantonensis]TCJ15175.1 TonB-dependent receptor [Parasulfuritortus cantonensis]